MKNLIWIVVAGVVVLGTYMLYSGKSPEEVVADASDAVDAPEALAVAQDGANDALIVIDTVVKDAAEASADAGDALANVASDVAQGAERALGEANQTVRAMVDDARGAAEDSAAAVEQEESTEVAIDDTAQGEPITEGTEETAAADESDAAPEVSATPPSEELLETDDDAPAVGTAADETAVTEENVDGMAEAAADGTEGVETPASDDTGETSGVTEEAVDEAAEMAADGTEEAEVSVEADATADVEITREELETLLTPEGFDLERVAAYVEASDLDDAEKTLLKAVLERSEEDPDRLAEVLSQLREALEMEPVAE